MHSIFLFFSIVNISKHPTILISSPAKKNALRLQSDDRPQGV